MLRLIIVLTAMSLPLLTSSESFSKPRLYGMVVVIDPGHGGRDPGAHGTFNGGAKKVIVREAEYVFDVSCRLWHMVRKYGAVAVMTTRDKKRKCRRDSRRQNKVIPRNKNKVFTLDGSRVVAGGIGLRRRVALGKKMLRKFPRHRVVFLSIHFDATGNKKLEGVHFIAPSSRRQPEIIKYLVKRFSEANRLRRIGKKTHYPVTVSGDKKHGIRRIYVLSTKTNPIRQRVLIELGNFTNPRDVWRIRDPRVRENYAQLITRALFDLNKIPIRNARR